MDEKMGVNRDKRDKLCGEGQRKGFIIIERRIWRSSMLGCVCFILGFFLGCSCRFIFIFIPL